MTKAELQAELEAKDGFVAIISDVTDRAIQNEASEVIKNRGHWEVEYTDGNGYSQEVNVSYVEDVVAGTATYKGRPPVFQPVASEAEANRIALIAFMDSKTTWKGYQITHLEAERNFAYVTVTQKDTVNQHYDTTFLVYMVGAELVAKEIAKSDYTPV